ncbi:unnamed protein product [Paramecium primaurelia]|uniref:Calpain catalytic domain-containing protein n=1 Tax=Paramecium primaurelia TaxID=5886 RepID=A0A8S1LMZ2_PARPR|nr:unnamed protein product [Paramecium primaurelia]
MLQRLPNKCKEEYYKFNQIGNERQTFIDSDFDYTDQNSQIQFLRIGSLQLNKNIQPCSEFKRSQYYQDNSLINAFNILQKDIQFVKNIYLNLNSLYGVWLNLQGEWHLIKIDEKIPCYLTGNIQKLATLECECEWPIIIEKAIVKVLGKNYDILNRLIEESIESFMFMLIGQPIIKVSTEDINNLKNVIISQMQFHSLLFAVQKQNGLECGYVIQTIVKGNIKEQELIQMRAANRNLVIQGQQQIQNDKCIFFLTFKQFSEIFPELCIIQHHPNYQWNSKELFQQEKREFQQYIENTYCYDFDIIQESHLYISICQRDQNFNSNQLVSPIKYGLIRILISKKNDDQYEFLTGDYNIKQNVCLDIQSLAQGSYTLFCQAYFYNQIENNPKLQQEQQRLFVQYFGSSVPDNLIINKNDIQEQSKLMLASLAIANVNEENTRTYEQLEQPEIQVTTQMNLGMLYFYYRNMGTTKIEEEVIFDNCDNIIDYETMKTLNKFNVTVPPHIDYLKLYVYDPFVIFNEDQPIFQYSCNIKSLVHSSKKTLMAQSTNFSKINNKQSIFESTANNPSLELITYMKENAKQATRIWNNNHIDVQMYIYQHQEGVIILYLNNTQNIYEEKLTFILDNLTINCTASLRQGNQVFFQLDSYAHLFIYLDIIDIKKPYSHKIQCIYTHYKDI